MSEFTVGTLFDGVTAVVKDTAGFVVAMYNPIEGDKVKLNLFPPPDGGNADPVEMECEEDRALGIVRGFYALYWDGFYDRMFDE